MSKLIIKNETTFLSDLEALTYVTEVVKGGRVSEYGKQYCFVTSWSNGVVVIAQQTKKGTDTFIVQYLPQVN